MIIDEYKVIFIHIPKTAGTSIEYYFTNKNWKRKTHKHTDIHEIKERFKDIYNSYRKFTIIRNPYDKLISYYFFLNKIIYKNANAIQFNNWVKKPSMFWNFNNPINILKPQYKWIDNTVEVIKFENLNNELSDFFNKKICLPIKNKSNHDCYLSYYNRESLDIVYNAYKKDFKKFNYKKL